MDAQKKYKTSHHQTEHHTDGKIKTTWYSETPTQISAIAVQRVPCDCRGASGVMMALYLKMMMKMMIMMIMMIINKMIIDHDDDDSYRSMVMARRVKMEMLTVKQEVKELKLQFFLKFFFFF